MRLNHVRLTAVVLSAAFFTGCYSDGRWTMPKMTFWKPSESSKAEVSSVSTHSPDAPPRPSNLAGKESPAPGAGLVNAQTGAYPTTPVSFTSTNGIGQYPYPSTQTPAPEGYNAPADNRTSTQHGPYSPTLPATPAGPYSAAQPPSPAINAELAYVASNPNGYPNPVRAATPSYTPAPPADPSVGPYHVPAAPREYTPPVPTSGYTPPPPSGGYTPPGMGPANVEPRYPDPAAAAPARAEVTPASYSPNALPSPTTGYAPAATGYQPAQNGFVPPVNAPYNPPTGQYRDPAGAPYTAPAAAPASPEYRPGGTSDYTPGKTADARSYTAFDANVHQAGYVR